MNYLPTLFNAGGLIVAVFLVALLIWAIVAGKMEESDER